ncbi:MAG: tripartite tricarboxylate transporter substrate binding protein [Betaproteobacteria bacterium]
MNRITKIFKAIFISSIVISTSFTQAQDNKTVESYPKNNVRVLVTTAPGGASDIIIRPIAEKLSSTFGQSFYIDNRAGASGIIAMDAGAKAPPDGYTLTFGTVGTFASNPAVHSKLPYDSIKDYAHVALIGKTFTTLIVSPKLPVNSLKEFVEYAKVHKGTLTYGSYGMGSFAHLMAASFSDSAGIETIHVPYKGSLPAITALMSGEIDFIVDTLPSALPFIKQNRVKSLAISSPDRYFAAPEIPTFTESGYPQFNPVAWWAVAAPAKTPAGIVKKLNATINVALKSPELIQMYKDRYVEPVGGSPEDCMNFIKAEVLNMTAIAKKANISIKEN